MRRMLVILTVFSLIMLSACGVQVENTRVVDYKNFVVMSIGGDDIGVLVDKTTGCKYLLYTKSAYESGITAYLDENGKPQGCKGVK